MKRWKEHRFLLVYIAVLIAFTIYALLDVFVLPHSYMETGTQTSEAEGVIGRENAITDASSWVDEYCHIEILDYRVNNTTVYVANITVADPILLKTAFAHATYGRNISATVSDISGSVGAILAINGDFYGARVGGYVIRNGTLYSNERSDWDSEDLVVFQDGTFQCVAETDYTAEQLLEMGAIHVFCFGPPLVEDGEIVIQKDQEIHGAEEATHAQRTAIGLVGENQYVFVVCDGRTEESEGLTLYELAGFMKDLGVQTAYNLDGGGSATMVFNGEVVNKPTWFGKKIEEREVSDIVYIGY